MDTLDFGRVNLPHELTSTYWAVDFLFANVGKSLDELWEDPHPDDHYTGAFRRYCWHYRSQCLPPWETDVSEEEFLGLPLGLFDGGSRTVRSVMGATHEQFAHVYACFQNAIAEERKPLSRDEREEIQQSLLTTLRAVDALLATLDPDPGPETHLAPASSRQPDDLGRWVLVDGNTTRHAEREQIDSAYLRGCKNNVTKGDIRSQVNLCRTLAGRTGIEPITKILDDHGYFRHARDLLNRNMAEAVRRNNREWAAYCERKGLGRNSRAAMQALFHDRSTLEVIATLAAAGLEARHRERLAKALRADTRGRRRPGSR
ncbi:hypothetical protein [Streptomyces sp. NPDC001594]|uniref:hypothetical protein n=1 Tax=Streptomyces sp. NPDC001594 TaxID=3364590 RepID=UPI003675DC85